jgi:hypothetical protein
VIGTFTIYHCPDIPKVGCTNNLSRRHGQYPEGTKLEVLEILENVSEEEAGDKEWFWADHFGYERGMHYTQCGPTSHFQRAETMGSVALAAARQKQIETMGPEGLSAASQKRADNIGRDGYKAIRQKQIQTLGHEGLSAIAVERWNQKDAEERSAIISKGWETRRRNKLLREHK